MKYLMILFGFLSAAAALQWFGKIKLWDNPAGKKQVLAWLALTFFIGLGTDYYASVMNGIWIFPGNQIIGSRILSLPIEEYLFFLIVPYFMLALYRALGKYFNTY